MKMDPNGKMPPSSIIIVGSINLHDEYIGIVVNTCVQRICFAYHFFSGIGLGTVFTLQGTSALPDKFRPRIPPTRFNGSTTNKQIQATMS